VCSFSLCILHFLSSTLEKRHEGMIGGSISQVPGSLRLFPLRVPSGPAPAKAKGAKEVSSCHRLVLVQGSLLKVHNSDR
jgi:hypothetical protein